MALSTIDGIAAEGASDEVDNLLQKSTEQDVVATTRRAQSELVSVKCFPGYIPFFPLLDIFVRLRHPHPITHTCSLHFIGYS